MRKQISEAKTNQTDSNARENEHRNQLCNISLQEMEVVQHRRDERTRRGLSLLET